MRRKLPFMYRLFSVFLSVVLAVSFVIPVHAQSAPILSGVVGLNLPAPGVMVVPTKGFVPAVIRGVQIFPENPLRFDFIVDRGDFDLEDEAFAEEATRLIKYFLTTLTVPDEDLWVNLSPYEKDRIVAEELGMTEMGRDLLAQDYLLKQITASLIYPEGDLGKQFWDRVYEKAYRQYGTTDIPVDIFNKVWIVPEKAGVYVEKDKAYVVESYLKVMLEKDYLALKKNFDHNEFGPERGGIQETEKISETVSSVIREIILPEIEKEVNEGENFALLRQIYHSMILATWYKRHLKESILGKIYIEKNKVIGVDVEDREIKEKIYQQYLEAFKKGVYDYIREEYDPAVQEIIPRKYFSGGAELMNVGKVLDESYTEKQAKDSFGGERVKFSTLLDPQQGVGLVPRGTVKKIGSEQGVTGDGRSKRETSRNKKIIDKSKLSKSQLDWLDYHEQIFGVFDPSEEIVQIVDLLARAVLDEKGLVADDYLILVVDDDSVNASINTSVKVVNFHWGLIQFLKRNDILAYDTIKFILGHEAGHALVKKVGEEQTSPAEEYRADEHGLASMKVNVNGKAHNPLAALYFMSALRRENKEAQITISHPQTHRREVKIYNDIRQGYWENLQSDLEQIPEEVVDIERSERHQFDEELYEDLSMAHFQKMLEKAKTAHEVRKVANFFNLYVAYSIALQEVMGDQHRYLEWGILNGMGYEVSTVDKILYNRKDEFSKLLSDNPDHFWLKKFLEEQASSIQFKETVRKKTEELIQKSGKKVSVEDVLMRVLWHAMMKKSAGYLDIGESNMNMSDTRKEMYQPKLFKERGIFSFHDRLLGKMEELVPKISEFSDLDKKQLMNVFLLPQISYLTSVKESESRTQYAIDFYTYQFSYRLKKWQNPEAVLSFIFNYTCVYRNPYFELQMGWENMGKGGGPLAVVESFASERVSEIKASIVEDILRGYKPSSLEAVARIFKGYLNHVYYLNLKIKDKWFDGIYSELKELMFNRINNMDDLLTAFNILGSAGADEFNDLKDLPKWIEKAESEDVVLKTLEFMLSQQALRLPAKKHLKDFSTKLLELGTSPEMVIKELDQMISQNKLEETWKEDLDFIAGYIPVIEKIEDGDEKERLIKYYYGKMSHQTTTFEEPQAPEDPKMKEYGTGDGWMNSSDFDAYDRDLKAFREGPVYPPDHKLVRMLMPILKKKGLGEKGQLEYLLNNGIIPYDALYQNMRLVTTEKNEILELLLKNEENFKKNNIDEETFNELFSRMVWEFFVPSKKEEATNDTLIADLKEVASRLRPCSYNVKAVMDYFTERTSFVYARSGEHYLARIVREGKYLSQENLDILFRLTANFKIGFSLPRIGVGYAFYDEFNWYEEGGPKPALQQYLDHRGNYVPMLFRDTEGYSEVIVWGIELIKLVVFLKEQKKIYPGIDGSIASWLKDLENVSLEKKIDWVIKAFPKSKFRNRILVELIGDPFIKEKKYGVDPEAQDPLVFEPIMGYLADSLVKEVLATRILNTKRKNKSLKLENYTQVEALIKEYYSKESLAGRQMFDILLQDADVTIPQLEGDRSEGALDILAKSKTKGMVHWGIELLADNIEMVNPKDKRILFEWLIGLERWRDKPHLLKYFEYLLHTKLDDLDAVLDAEADAIRQSFFSTLFLGPRGIFASPTERSEFLKKIYEFGSGEKASEDSILFVIFKETFEASPQVRQMDFVDGIFRGFHQSAKNRGDEEGNRRNVFILEMLSGFGGIGKKVGQFLSKQPEIDRELRIVLEDLSSKIPPISKRYLLNALMADSKEKFEEARAQIEVIGKLLGSATIGQVYQALLKDGRAQAIKYLRPMAHFDVKENLETLEVVLFKRLPGKNKELDKILRRISKPMFDQISISAKRELIIANETDTQESLGEFSNKEMPEGGWTLHVPRVDPNLKGSQYFINDLVKGTPLSQAVIDRLKRDEQFISVAKLIVRALLRQMFVHGEYHADLHGGNILIDVEPKHVNLLDYGNTGVLSLENADLLIAILMNLQGKNSEDVVTALKQITGEKGWTGDLGAELEKMILDENVALESKLRGIKKILDESGVEFIDEFDILFKTFESIKYLTEAVSAEDIAMIFTNAIMESKMSDGEGRAKKKSGVSDKAMISDGVGGIDFTPQIFKIDVEGNTVEFFSPNIQQLQSMDLTGFSPIIINVSPVGKSLF